MKSTRLLIVYGSKRGHTARIAQRMRDAASAVDGVQVELAGIDEANESHVAVADLFIIAGPVYFGRHDRKLEEFVGEHLGVIASRSSAFVSVGLASAEFSGKEEAETAADKFLEATGWIPDRVGLFAGGLPYRQYNFFVRWIMRRIANKKGLDTDTSRDYDYTDWEAVDEFARQFVKTSRTAAA